MREHIGAVLFCTLGAAFFFSTWVSPRSAPAWHPSPLNSYRDSNPCYPIKWLMTTSDSGRLGNLMSEYSSLWVASRMAGYQPAISELMSRDLGEVFPGITIKYNPNLTPDCRNKKQGVNIDIPKTDLLLTNPNVSERAHHFVLGGYPNAVRLYYPKRKELLKEFQFKENVTLAARYYINHIVKTLKVERKNLLLVGIHVRRTDYNYHLNVTAGAKLVEPEFFKRAIQTMETELKDHNLIGSHTKVLYVVASDDPTWCQENVPSTIPDRQFQFTSDSYSAVSKAYKVNLRDFDLAVMGSMDHSIYDYGTYGFWGAFMAGGRVVLAQNIGTRNPEVENIKRANPLGWTFINASTSDYVNLIQNVILL